MAKESGWVTINGVHVFIDNSGKISKGPAKFIGSTVNDLPSSGKSAADRKAELKAKYGDKKSGAKTEPESSSDSPKAGETMRDFLKRTSKYPDRSRASRTTRGAVAGTAKFNPTSEKKTGVKEKVKESVETGKKAFEDSMAAIKGRPDPKPGETMRDYEKRTGSSIGSSSRTRGRGSSDSTSSAEKTGFSHVDKLNAKVAELEALEGKSATAKNIKAAMDRSVDGSMSIGGQTTLKNKFGESVTVSKNYGIYGGAAGLQASIQHSDGSVSLVYASTPSDLSKRINDRNAHYNAPGNKAPANTGNPAFDGATTHIIKKIK